MDDAGDAELRLGFRPRANPPTAARSVVLVGPGLAQAVFFFVPWFWWIRRSVRLCQEYVADAAAAKAGAAADEYAEFLVTLARGSAPLLGATGLGSSSDLLRRVQMLLQSSTRVQGSWPRGRSLVAAGGLLAVAVLAGGVGLRAEAPKDEKKTDETKRVIVVTPDGNPQEFKQSIIRGDGVFQKGNVVFRLIEDGDEKKADEDAKRSEKKGEKKTVRMTVIIDAGNGPITIPLDGNTADIGKEIEKAMKKAHEQADAAWKQHSQAIEKAMAVLRRTVRRTDQAIGTASQGHEVQKDQVQAERDKAFKLQAAAAKLADDARRAQNAADVEGKVLRGFQIQGNPAPSPRTRSGDKSAAIHCGTGRHPAGAQVKKPRPISPISSICPRTRARGIRPSPMTQSFDRLEGRIESHRHSLGKQLAGKPCLAIRTRWPTSSTNSRRTRKSPGQQRPQGTHRKTCPSRVPEPKRRPDRRSGTKRRRRAVRQLKEHPTLTPNSSPGTGLGNVKWHVVDPTGRRSPTQQQRKKLG